MRPDRPRSPHGQETGEGGPELSPAIRELLAAERTPPGAPVGLEARLWSRLEDEIGRGAASGGGGPSGPVDIGLMARPWWLAAGFIAVAGVVIGVYFGVAAPERAPAVEAPVVSAPAGAAGADRVEHGSSGVARSEQAVVPGTGGRAASRGGDEAEARDAEGDVAAVAPVGAATGRVGPAPTDHPDGGVAPAEPSGPAGGAAGPVVEPLDERASSEELVAAPKPKREAAGTRDPVAERALLTKARAALREGAHAEAFASLTEHMRLFPRGELAEEREALKVHAFAAAGRSDEGRRARARFVARFPNSIHTPGLNALAL